MKRSASDRGTGTCRSERGIHDITSGSARNVADVSIHVSCTWRYVACSRDNNSFAIAATASQLVVWHVQVKPKTHKILPHGQPADCCCCGGSSECRCRPRENIQHHLIIRSSAQRMRRHLLYTHRNTWPFACLVVETTACCHSRPQWLRLY